MGGGSGALSSMAMGPQPGMVASAPGLMTSSPYVQPWTANTEGTPPPTGYDQPAPNPTASTYVDPAAPLVMKGQADVRDREFADFALKPMPALKDKTKNEIKYVGAITPQPSATGGAYGMPASTWGGPVYKSTAGKYYWDKAGKYPIPAEALALGGFK